jgi:hypothetical protein
MKRGFKPHFLMDDEVMYGINLSIEGWAEHEWGISRIEQAFSIDADEAILGPYRYKVQSFPKETCVFEKIPDGAILLFDEERYGKTTASEHIHSRYPSECLPRKTYPDPTLGAGWSDHDFCVVTVRSPMKITYLKEVYEALKRKDAAIWVQRDYHNSDESGLCIIILSCLPTPIQNLVLEEHIDDRTLLGLHKEVCDKLHLYEKLCNLGFRTLNLSPRLSRKEDGTDFPIVYFICPYGDLKARWGRITIEELLAFIDGDSTIMYREEENNAIIRSDVGRPTQND